MFSVARRYSGSHVLWLGSTAPVVLLLLALTVTRAQAEIKDEGFEKFISLFQEELHNRGFSRMSFPVMAEVAHTEEEQLFFETYTQLEKINEKRYLPYAEKYGLSMSAPGSAKLKLAAGRFSYWLMPETTWKIMHKATLRYMDNLQILLSLAPPEDRHFFVYVVAQEQAQLNAYAAIASSRNVASGTTVLEEFIRANHPE